MCADNNDDNNANKFSCLWIFSIPRNVIGIRNVCMAIPITWVSFSSTLCLSFSRLLLPFRLVGICVQNIPKTIQRYRHWHTKRNICNMPTCTLTQPRTHLCFYDQTIAREKKTTIEKVRNLTICEKKVGGWWKEKHSNNKIAIVKVSCYLYYIAKWHKKSNIVYNYVNFVHENIFFSFQFWLG